MAYRPIWAYLVLLLFTSAFAQRRGGEKGGHDDDDDDGFVSPGDTGDSSGGESSSGGGSGPSAPCGWHERQKSYGLPGLYYNGTLTIQHHLKDSTVWDEPRDGMGEFSWCGNDDKSPKTYTYPALLLIAPTGDSDTNPMHWVLRAFQPADQTVAPSPNYIDIEQRWVYIRSSDFITWNETYKSSDYSSVWPTLGTWSDSDATGLNTDTRVYWRTEVASEDDGTFSARAEYSESPPETADGNYHLSTNTYGRHTSQYVTLSDVCIFHQTHLRGVGTGMGPPRSGIYDGETDYATTTPSIWLAKGATAEMLSIGADEMTLTLNNSLERVVPMVGLREAKCPPKSVNPFEFSNFIPLHSIDGSSATPWNLTLDVMLSFRGSVVRENSTTLRGLEGDELLFEDGYDLGAVVDDEEDDCIGLHINKGIWATLVLGVALCVCVL